MKEFDKYWDKLYYLPTEYDAKSCMADVWKAALEWALKELDYKYETSLPGVGWQGSFIEEELKDE